MTIPVITAAVEGDVDEAVARRLVQQCGGTLGPVHGRRGKSHLKRSLGGYNHAAEHGRWLVLVDLDQDAACAPTLRKVWLPIPARRMCFRVAVPEIEAWLLADRERLAQFLGVSPARIPRDPESLGDPKQTLVELARQARRREVREDMVPRAASGRTVGPAYTSRTVEFVDAHWRPKVAAGAADSLRRCLDHVDRLVNAP